MVIKLLWQCYINMHPLAVRERMAWRSEPPSFLVCLRRLQGNCHRFAFLWGLKGNQGKATPALMKDLYVDFLYSFKSLPLLIISYDYDLSQPLFKVLSSWNIWLPHEWEPSVMCFHLTVWFWVLHNAYFTRLVTSCSYFCNLRVKGNSLY